MYNGIGLASVRGSGTNGYVTKNMAHVSRQRQADRKSQDHFREPPKLKAPAKANSEILDHNRKREVEVKCLALQEQLEEQGLAADEVEEKVSALRTKLLLKLPGESSSSDVGGRTGETHADAERKAAEAAALKGALGISESYVPGQAFDRELQQRLKEERMAKREAEEQARREAEEELEREREREERRKRKEARREEKEAAREEKKMRKSKHRDEKDD